MLEVFLDRVLDDAEPLSDFFIGQSLQEQQDDLPFAGGAPMRSIERKQIDPRVLIPASIVLPSIDLATLCE